MQAKQSLPQEPAEHEANISKIRVRKPTGDHLERRFYTRDTLQVNLLYMLSWPEILELFILVLGSVKFCCRQWLSD